MNITENYIGYDALVSYLIESKNQTYYRFLNLNRDIIISSLNSLTNFSLTLDKWQNFDITWYKRYLYEAKKLFEPDIFVAIKDKIKTEHSQHIKELQIFWQEIIKDFDISEISQSNLPKKKQKVIKKCDKKNLTLTELSQPDTSLPKKTETLQPDLQVVKEYEKENLVLAQPDWNKKLILQDRQTRELRRVREDDTEDTDRSWKKQIQILEQNKNNLVYKQIKNVLSLANESMLQAIVESLLPLKYRVPELSLVMDGKKLKGSGRFGYSDIFVLKGIGDNYISLELKYISLVGEILNNGISQLKSYMNTISKGKVANYSSSGVFDKRIETINSNPNKLKGFVILAIPI
ncbi:hypothetical protein GLOIN_2v1781418 [Rhizophagus irregularis DAOM 181602=DAOM 197198]|nr:hypothetical protein GLOIN_2v1781418 [Rhizophagus irregularis DAOM 181602=DAOM 197198]